MVGSGEQPHGTALVGAGGDQGLSQICSQTGPWGASASVSTSSGGGGFGVELGEPGGVGSRSEGPRGGEGEGGGQPGGGGAWGLQTIRA